MEKNNIVTAEEMTFWNNSEMVSHFALKKPDQNVSEKLSKIPNCSQKKAIDLGCGGGRHTELLFTLGFDVYACDVNPEMIKSTIARMKNKFPSYTEKIVFGDVVSPPFTNNYFDVIVSTGVLHQVKSLKDYEKAIFNLSRLIKPGGIACLHIFTNKTVDPSLTEISPNVFVTKEQVWMTMISKEHFYLLMKKNGFELEEEISEITKNVNTGPRSILKANFIKPI